MKIHILYDNKDSPWGGGNQFLTALKRAFTKLCVYADDPALAEVILVNSHHKLRRCVWIKQRWPNKIIVHRINGPVSLIRGRDQEIDRIIALFSKTLADGIVFQSIWCRAKNKNLFGISAKYETVIKNAADNDIFSAKKKRKIGHDQRTKLIASSWSANPRKGFEIYRYLDDNLDFRKYKMVFVGNSPLKFRNIEMMKPVKVSRLASILRDNDIFVTASRNDPCSNSVIEALACHLPVVAVNDGGHPELVQQGGAIFRSEEDVIQAIEKVATNYEYYQSQIPCFSINVVARRYHKFAQTIYCDVQNGKYKSKQIALAYFSDTYKLGARLFGWKVQRILGGLS